MSFEYNIAEDGTATKNAESPTGISSFINPAMDILTGSKTKGASYDLVRRGALTLVGATVAVTSVMTRSRIVNAVQGGQPVPAPFAKFFL